MRTRFHPKRRASTDQTPGPRSASAAPRVPMSTHVHGFPRWIAACTNPRIASIVPAIGVHKPTRRSSPTAIVSICSKADPSGGAPRSPRTPWARPIPAARRSKRRPNPGAPLAKFEKSRRKIWGAYRSTIRAASPKGRAKHSFECRFLSFDDSALHSNDGGVSAVFGSQFQQDASDLTFYGIFGHR